jgi:hypothetical protein
MSLQLLQIMQQLTLMAFTSTLSRRACKKVESGDIGMRLGTVAKYATVQNEPSP